MATTQDELTENDLLRALEEARTRAQAGDTSAGAGAMTTAELVEHLGWHKDRVYEILAILKAQGLVEVVQVTRLNLADRRSSVPAYRLTSSQADACTLSEPSDDPSSTLNGGSYEQ